MSASSAFRPTFTFKLATFLSVAPALLVGTLAILPHIIYDNHCPRSTAKALTGSTDGQPLPVESLFSALRNVWSTQQHVIVPQLHAANSILASYITKCLLDTHASALPVILVGLLCAVCPISTAVAGAHTISAMFCFLLGSVFLLKGFVSQKSFHFAVYAFLVATGIWLNSSIYTMQLITIMAVFTDALEYLGPQKVPSKQFVIFLALSATFLGMLAELILEGQIRSHVMSDISRHINLVVDVSAVCILDGLSLWRTVSLDATALTQCYTRVLQLAVSRTASFDIFAANLAAFGALVQSAWRVVVFKPSASVHGLSFVWLSLSALAVTQGQFQRYHTAGVVGEYYLSAVLAAVSIGVAFGHSFYRVFHATNQAPITIADALGSVSPAIGLSLGVSLLFAEMLFKATLYTCKDLQ